MMTAVLAAELSGMPMRCAALIGYPRVSVPARVKLASAVHHGRSKATDGRLAR